MADAQPGVRFTFLDYVGLGFILTGVEEILRRPKEGWPIYVPGLAMGLTALALRDRSPYLVGWFLAWIRAPKQLTAALTENAELKKRLTQTVGTPATSKLVIHSANYAAWSGGGHRYDVTRFMRSIIRGDGLVFGPIENHSFVVDGDKLVPDDPLTGKPKRLEVTYSYDGEQSKTIRRTEHGRLTLPEDSGIDWLGSELNRVSAERDRFQQENRQLTIQREIDVQKAKLRDYPHHPVFTVEKVIPEGPATSPTVYLKNKVRLILTNHSDADVSVWTPVWESPDVHAEGDPPKSTIQSAIRDWQFDEWGEEKTCATVGIGCSFRCYIALKPTVGESIYRRLETGTPLGTLVFPVKIHGKLYDIRINI